MAVEETREQQQMYNTFRSCIYLFLIVELIMNLPITADNRVTGFILELITRFKVFNNVASCKLIELICIGVTCIGTRPQKALKFNVKTMVLYPIGIGITFIALCMMLHKGIWGGVSFGQGNHGSFFGTSVKKQRF